MKSATAIPKGEASRLMVGAALKPAVEQPSTAYVAGVKVKKSREINSDLHKYFKRFSSTSGHINEDGVSVKADIDAVLIKQMAWLKATQDIWAV
ncbi:MAG TPA: hypothetical protein VF290_11885 [Pyrinomonadaceae bacterium]